MSAGRQPVRVAAVQVRRDPGLGEHVHRPAHQLDALGRVGALLRGGECVGLQDRDGQRPRTTRRRRPPAPRPGRRTGPTHRPSSRRSSRGRGCRRPRGRAAGRRRRPRGRPPRRTPPPCRAGCARASARSPAAPRPGGRTPPRPGCRRTARPRRPPAPCANRCRPAGPARRTGCRSGGRGPSPPHPETSSDPVRTAVRIPASVSDARTDRRATRELHGAIMPGHPGASDGSLNMTGTASLTLLACRG